MRERAFIVAGGALGLLLCGGCRERDCGVVRDQTAQCTQLTAPGPTPADVLACCPPVVQALTAANPPAHLELAPSCLPAQGVLVKISGSNLSPQLSASLPGGPVTAIDVAADGGSATFTLPAGAAGPLTLSNTDSQPVTVPFTRVRTLVAQSAVLTTGAGPLWAQEVTLGSGGSGLAVLTPDSMHASSVALYLAQGQASSGQSFTGGYHPAYIAGADLGGTGFTSLIVAAPGEMKIAAFTAFDTTNGDWTMPVALMTSVAQPGPLGAAATAGAYLVAAAVGTQVTTWSGTPGALSSIASAAANLPTEPAGLAVADFDGNGTLDVLALVADGAGHAAVHIQKGGVGAWAPVSLKGLDGSPIQAAPASTSRPAPLAAVDVTGDRQPELIALDADGKTLWVLSQDGAALYRFAPGGAVAAITLGVAADQADLLVSAGQQVLKLSDGWSP